MVGARAPATRPGSGQFAQRSARRKSPQRPAVERIPAHHGPGRRPIEDKRTLNSHLNRSTSQQLNAAFSGAASRGHFSLMPVRLGPFYVASLLAPFSFLIPNSSFLLSGVTARRFSYWFLFAIFIVAIVLAAIRPLRVSPMYQVIGVIQFGAMAFAAWTLGARAITSTSRGPRLLALAGIFLITPFALLALLWVGLGPPWQATPAENQMRYLVLTAMTIAIVVGFVVLREALGEADIKFRSSVGFATIMLAGPDRK